MPQILIAERSTGRFGAHAVIESVASKNEINRALKVRDPRLFLEQQLNLDNEHVWCVVLETTDPQLGCVTIYEWRDPQTDEPINHPTMGILQEIDRRMARGPINVKEIDRRNKEKQKKRANEMREHVVDIAVDFAKHWGIGNFQIIPRSRQLMLTRSRVRRQEAEARLDAERRAQQRRALLRELGVGR